MDEATVCSWVDGYIRAWETNDPDDIGHLFAQDAEYYTAPYAEPWRSRDGIVAAWLDGKDEPGDWEFRYEPMVVAGELAIVRGWTKYLTPPPREYSNLWIIRLDAEGRCSEFTEWYMQHR